MLITPIKTERITPGMYTLEEIVTRSIDKIEERSILAITSKLVSLCENRVVSGDSISKEQLIWQESEYLTAEPGKYGHQFTIANNTLIPSAGIDESNADGHFVLWPEDVQRSANDIRRFLNEHYNVKEVGVIITDSTCTPLRWGTSGIAIAHSGFEALRDYIGQPDLFGRDLEVTKANLAGGLAAAAVVTMGEGAESTPLCMIADIPFVTFQAHDPTAAELDMLRIPIEDDLFSPFLTAVEWKRGGKLC